MTPTSSSSSSPSLLREWTYNRNKSPAVPVAPAVVVQEEEEEQNGETQPLSASVSSTTYGYPVATFVRELVRTGMEHIYGGVGMETTASTTSTQHSVVAQQQQDPQEETPTSLLSIRSTNTTNNAHHESSSASSIAVPLTVGEPSGRGSSMASDDAYWDEAEFVLIDGDLVALPPPPPNRDEMEGMEEQSKHRRKAFRGIRKLFKKKKPKAAEEEKKKQRNHRRRSWLRAQEGEVQQQQQLQEHEVALAPHHRHHPLVVPAMTPISECTPTLSAVSADFIGNVDQLRGVAAAPGVLNADAYIEPADEKDLKVDSLLSQARSETDVEQDHALFGDSDEPGSLLLTAQAATTAAVVPTSIATKPSLSIQGTTRCPLSFAATGPMSDAQQRHEVYNDTLKIVMVGAAHEKSTLARALRQPSKKGRSPSKSRRPRSTLGVDVYQWNAPNDDVRVTIWDVQGATSLDASLANAGAHPSTQSLFYSPQALYLLVWDLAANNAATYVLRRDRCDTERSLGVDEDEEEDEFMMEQEIRRATRALATDIDENVLSWMDGIPRTATVLPVVTDCGTMDETEVRRRCDMMQGLLTKYCAARTETCPKLVFGTKDKDNNSLLRVDLVANGVEELQQTIVDMTTGTDRILAHVGEIVPPQTVHVLQTLLRLKQNHKVILMDHLMAEMELKSSVEDVSAALLFLASIGEILYFGSKDDEVLSNYIILSRRWLVSALSCILRNDLKRELAETRRFMNLQCAYSGQAFSENDVAQTLLSSPSSCCPILSSEDSSMLWKSMSFMREAADRTSQLSEASSTMYDFLERLLVRKGIFLPIQVSRSIEQEEEPAPAYFVPSLLAQAEPSDVWTYKSTDSWMTTLCHTWLFRDGASARVMEHLTVSLLQDLYEFSHSFQGCSRNSLEHSTTYPMGLSSITEFVEAHDTEAIGRIKIHEVMSWKSSFLVKIGAVFCDAETIRVRESFTEVFVSLVDAQSNHCVASNSMTTGMKKLIVCCKGQVGHNGRKMWNGGYGLVLDSIKASLADLENIERQVVCPECLAHSHPSVASTWGWESVRAVSQSSNTGLRCTRGHVVDASLICGMCKPQAPVVQAISGPRVSKPVSSLLRATVLVGLWDQRSQKIHNVGSGFLVDKKNALVVTAGHILFDMREGSKFGTPYFGLKHAKAVIGVIPDEDEHVAVFRYFAEIVAHDINNIDACVLRITTRMELDVGGEGEACGLQAEIPLLNDDERLKNENLQHLRMTRRFELEETVRILGFNQGGEGVLEQGKHINRCADFAKGYICKKFKAVVDDNASESSSSTSFSPREEIVVMCPTISGHSGGPCVNDEGKVVGILSRADPADRQRCYLVPTSELKPLVSLARG